MLWAFNITQLSDADLSDGSAYQTDGLVMSPKKFNFRVSPRTGDVLSMINNEAIEAEARLREWE